MNYTLDASAIIALLKNEKGHEKTELALQSKDYKPFMHKINFVEVDYHEKRVNPKNWASKKKYLNEVITLSELLTSEITEYASYLKSTYRLSLADSIGLAFNRFMDTTFLTADRHELQIIAQREPIKIEFLR